MIGDAILTLLSVGCVMYVCVAAVDAWVRRPLAVRSDVLGRWVAARSQYRIEAP